MSYSIPGRVPGRALDDQPRLARRVAPRRVAACRPGARRRDRGATPAARGAPRRRGAGPAARCARPTAGTGRARRGSRTSGRRRRARAARAHQSTSKRASTVPRSTWSPACSGCAPEATSRPLTRTPLVEPRSAMSSRRRPAGSRRGGARRWRPPARCRTRGCGRYARRPARRVALALGQQHRAAARAARAPRAAPPGTRAAVE